VSVEEQRGSSTRRFEAALVRVDLEPDEAWLLHERGRLRIGPAQILEAIAGRPGYGVLPLDVEQAFEFGAVPTIRDPMDRLILAAARVTGSRLVTVDDSLGGYGVDVIWA